MAEVPAKVPAGADLPAAAGGTLRRLASSVRSAARCMDQAGTEMIWPVCRLPRASFEVVQNLISDPIVEHAKGKVVITVE